MGENGKVVRVRIGLGGLILTVCALAGISAYAQAGTIPPATIAHGEVPQSAQPSAAE